MADLKFVITDMDPQSNDYGTFRAVGPGQATGIAVPAFRVGPSTPAVGGVAGEGFINTTNRSAMVWDGSNWVPIVQGALLLYPDDASVIGDINQPAGTYATSGTTGNLFVKGPQAWRQIGVRTYATATALLADAGAPEGSLGVAVDEETFWVMHGGTWHCHSRRPVADVQALASWQNPPEGSTAMEQAHELRYHYHTGQWRPESIWVQTQATILASADRLEGQMAVASDTGNTWVWHSGEWIGSNIRHYATENDLLADTPIDGVMAWADDNGLVYVRFGGNWRRVNEPTVSVGHTAPANPAAGDLFYDTVNPGASIFDGAAWQPVNAVVRVPSVKRSPPGTGDLWLDTSSSTATVSVYDGSSWNPMGGSPIGTIIMYPNITPPPGYLLCDGSTINATTYPRLHALFSNAGGRLPDLKDQFIRGATSNSDATGSIKHQDTTRGPRNPFTGNTSEHPGHTHTSYYREPSETSGGIFRGTGGGGYFGYDGKTTSSNGRHYHSFTISNGGDPETAPKHVRLAFHIKHD